MYLKNTPSIVVDVLDVLTWLGGIDLMSFNMRVFYTRFTEDSTTDLLSNYPEKFLVNVLNYGVLNNLPLCLKLVNCDTNTYIYDIELKLSEEGSSKTLKRAIKELLRKDAISYVSHVELTCDTNEGLLYFLLKGVRDLQYPNYSLFNEPDQQIDVFEPIPREVSLEPDLLERYLEALQQNYDTFFRDVKGRSCAIWTVREGRCAYIVKRHIRGDLIYFPDSFAETADLIREEQIVQIVPATLPDYSKTPIELLIDIDTQGISYEQIKIISDQFAHWLIKKNLNFRRRLTGSWGAGQHFILPIQWDKLYILAGTATTPAWNVYKTKPKIIRLCDSVRHMAVLLILLFQVENQELAPHITTRVLDPVGRHNRVLFDTTPNAKNMGRHSLLSWHCRSFNICIPWNNNLPDAKEELHDLVNLDVIISEGLTYTEEESTPYLQRANTRYLREIIERHDKLYFEYMTTTRERFEERRFNKPIVRLR